MEVVKVIEVIATSTNSFSDAAANAVKEASKSIKNIQSVYVKEMNAKVENDSITSYAVNAKVSFLVNNSDNS
ncbi:dodecin family protein [Zobellia galactanivorans]|uniref:dodecin family protein n=1 Tax=Zobellia galactanivorans (strain DSM 12802 / CCUG 47099 / CIP 106680 / NCIMB 13871 / Dsij) TaxID=63186 RepID=UPI001C074381|nr:dodecin family protein [Zobellia galactanivorans]MBU3025220.1 dodecin family protein [Zobellia galactanivorans]MDO6810948.1 dodecin family protein [Zobellia galactanivorans]